MIGEFAPNMTSSVHGAIPQRVGDTVRHRILDWIERDYQVECAKHMRDLCAKHAHAKISHLSEGSCKFKVVGPCGVDFGTVGTDLDRKFSPRFKFGE